MGHLWNRSDLMTGNAFQIQFMSRQEQDITWNSSDKGANITLSNGNLDATGATDFDSVRATVGRSNGLRYFELLATAVSGTNVIVGIATSGADLTTWVGNSASGAGHQSNGTDYVNGPTLVNDPTTSIVTNDVISFAVNFVTGKAWIGINGTWLSSGNPAAGTNEWVSGISGTWYPTASPSNASGAVRIRTKTSQFTQSVPTGFISWAML